MAERGRRSAAPTAPPSSARDVACEVLDRIERERAFAGRALSAALDRARHLAPEDRGLATEIVYGVLRRGPRLDRALGAFASRGIADVDPAVRTAMRAAAYQILFLDRVPSYASVDDAVERCKRARGRGAAGFANAVLRRLASSGEPPLPKPTEDPLAWLVDAACLPEWLARLLLAELGPDRAVAFAEAIQRPAPTGLRVNALRTDVATAEKRLCAERPTVRLERATIAPWALLARSLDGIARTTSFAEGLITVQDVGAQVVVALCGASAGERILDACAGVGGKTAHLQALAGGRAEIEAADISGKKLAEAREAFRRLGVGGVRTTVADLTQRASATAAAYDRILLDAPCAGLGVLRRHPEALGRRTAADLPALAALQRQMLDALAPRLRPGGTLVYSVCTIDRMECEEVIDAFLASHADFLVDPPTEAPLATLIDARGFLRTWPDRHDADAFFAARLRRK